MFSGNLRDPADRIDPTPGFCGICCDTVEKVSIFIKSPAAPLRMKKSERPVQRVEFILAQCEGKEVLHLGCTNWPYTDASMRDDTLLHSAIANRSSRVFGIDADENGLERLRADGYTDLYLGDLENLSSCSLDRKFDVVLAGEVIEHLNNPGLFLEGVKRYLRPDSMLLLTTINAYCAMRSALYALSGRGGVNEPVHPDHVAYYSYSTLRLLLERHGYDIRQLLFYDLGVEHRKHLRSVVNLFNDVSVWFVPQFSDGIIATASPAIKGLIADVS